jgi:hypothetical protein
MSEDRVALDCGALNRLVEAVRIRNGQRHRRFYKLRDDGMLPLICPTCQNVCAGKASMPATPPVTLHGVVFDILVGSDNHVGYFDLEQKTLQPLDNPFGTRLSPMS